MGSCLGNLESTSEALGAIEPKNNIDEQILFKLIDERLQTTSKDRAVSQNPTVLAIVGV